MDAPESYIEMDSLARPRTAGIECPTMDAETREYLEALRHEFAAMREEMDTRFRVIDSRFDGVDSRFDAMDRRIEGEHETTRRHFDVVAEDLRHDLQAVAQGVLSNTRAIHELRSDVYRDMNARFSLVDLAFVDVQRQLAALRDSGPAR